jgi:hypothetical protein
MDKITVGEIVDRINRLTDGGGKIWVEPESGRLRYAGPSGLLLLEDEVFFREHRDAVIATIRDGVPVFCEVCRQPTALARPDDRMDETGEPDPRFSDLWEGRCPCGTVFSTANLTGLIVSEMVN